MAPTSDPWVPKRQCQQLHYCNYKQTNKPNLLRNYLFKMATGFDLGRISLTISFTKPPYPGFLICKITMYRLPWVRLSWRLDQNCKSTWEVAFWADSGCFDNFVTFPLSNFFHTFDWSVVYGKHFLKMGLATLNNFKVWRISTGKLGIQWVGK